MVNDVVHKIAMVEIAAQEAPGALGDAMIWWRIEKGDVDEDGDTSRAKVDVEDTVESPWTKHALGSPGLGTRHG